MEDEKPETSSYTKRPLWHWLLLYAVVAVVIYGLIYYFVLAKKGGYNNNSAAIPSYTTPTIMPTTPSKATSSAMETQKVTVTAKEFAFTPSTITLKKGQPAVITFMNKGTFPHNLTITSLGLATKTILPGQQDTITFTPDKTGQFAFLCTVPGHADKGMKGTLTVE